MMLSKESSVSTNCYREHVSLVTIRTPMPVRYNKMLNSIGKMVSVQPVTGTLIKTGSCT
jgi:hypothetical protein